jgi:hypothetical protein
MAATRGNLITAMVNYLKDQSTVIGPYLDAASVRGYEYVNKKYNVQKGEAMVSIPDPQTVTRANAGNIDEVYAILVSANIYKRSHTEESGDIQSILTAVRESLVADFVAERDTFWAYFSGLPSAGEVLSTKFNSVELSIAETTIDEAVQNVQLNFSVFVNLTRSRS